jgi:hypothetical protein
LITIKQLREQLDAWEADWTESDVQYLGSFEGQPVLTDSYAFGKTRSRSGPNAYQGLGAAKLIPYWELGLVIAQDDSK